MLTVIRFQLKRSVFKIKNLKEVKINETVFVKKVIGKTSLKIRLAELGITKDVEVFVKKIAPFGSPLQVFVRGYNLCIGLDEAKNILLK